MPGKNGYRTMHLERGLKEEGTKSLVDVFCHGAMDQIKPTDVVMFNPMGMAVFDIAIGAYYYQQAKEQNVGVLLEA